MFPYIALVLAQLGTSGKQYAMKNCGKLAPGPFNSVCINTMRALICLVVSLVIWLIAGGEVTTPFGHLIILLSGIVTAINLFTWILSSRIVSLTLLESLCMIGSLLVPMFLAPVLYNGETVSVLQWIGAALVFVAVFLFMNKEDPSVKKSGTPLQKALILILCAAGITTTTIFKKYYDVHIVKQGLGSAEYFTFINFVTILSVFMVLFAVFYQREKRSLTIDASEDASRKVELPYKKVWIFVLIAAAALYLNELFTVYANELNAAIYMPLSKGFNVACTFAMDIIVFKDKITVKKLIGLVTVIVAIILVTW